MREGAWVVQGKGLGIPALEGVHHNGQAASSIGTRDFMNMIWHEIQTIKAAYTAQALVDVLGIVVDNCLAAVPSSKTVFATKNQQSSTTKTDSTKPFPRQELRFLWHHRSTPKCTNTELIAPIHLRHAYLLGRCGAAGA